MCIRDSSGYKTKNGFFSFGGPTVDSGVIGKKDFEKFMSSMTDANKTVQARKTHPANSEASKSAVADMGMGMEDQPDIKAVKKSCLLYTSPSPRDATLSRMPSSA
uniref:Uncharacterized protein n=1 Tax=Ralstonia solanacearum TaxID=305 RepID=A0A0S4VC84_RALSL|nr:protein of unknown function [Ralstonia solanacearum]